MKTIILAWNWHMYTRTHTRIRITRICLLYSAKGKSDLPPVLNLLIAAPHIRESNFRLSYSIAPLERMITSSEGDASFSHPTSGGLTWCATPSLKFIILADCTRNVFLSVREIEGFHGVNLLFLRYARFIKKKMDKTVSWIRLWQPGLIRICLWQMQIVLIFIGRIDFWQFFD